MRKLTVVGMGPGHPDYLLPAGRAAIERADVVAAGNRHLKTLDTLQIYTERIPIDAGLAIATERIEEALIHQKNVVVCVSGDPGFYSLLGYLKKHIDTQITVIPGISSLSYLFNKLGLPYQDARFTSLHGRETSIRELVENNKITAFLTDLAHSPAYVAKLLRDMDVMIVVGENLSYEDERIAVLKPEEAMRYVSGGLCVIAVINEDDDETI